MDVNECMCINVEGPFCDVKALHSKKKRKKIFPS